MKFFVALIMIATLSTQVHANGNNDAYQSCVIFMKMSTADQLNLIEQTNRKYGDFYTLEKALSDCRSIISAHNQPSRPTPVKQACINTVNCPSTYQCINWQCEPIGGPTTCSTGGQCSPGEVCCASMCKVGMSCE